MRLLFEDLLSKDNSEDKKIVEGLLNEIKSSGDLDVWDRRYWEHPLEKLVEKDRR